MPQLQPLLGILQQGEAITNTSVKPLTWLGSSSDHRQGSRQKHTFCMLYRMAVLHLLPQL